MTTQNNPDSNEPGEALKACPFCGAEAAIYYHGGDGALIASDQVDVGCAGGCTITPRVVGSTDPDADENLQWAITEWNSRASLAAVGGDADNTEERLLFASDVCRSQQYRISELERRVASLLRYASHSGGCTSYTNSACTCGLDQLCRNLDAAASSPAPAEPEGEQEKLTGITVGSSRHPHFTHADHERMKATLDALSDNPTEEEAEAVLQACGTSGKEVINGFIEQLLRERSEMQAELERLRAATPPETPAAAMRAAKEWFWTTSADMPPAEVERLAAIITRYLAATPVPEALSRASKVCRSTIPGARVELIFQNLEDAQAVHQWLANLKNTTTAPDETAVGEEAKDNL